MKLPLYRRSRPETRIAQPASSGTSTSCEAVWDLLSLYADGEATGDETAMVESHIAVCVGCSRDLQFMQSTQVSFSTLPAVAPPPTLRAAILAATVDRQRVQHPLSALIQRMLAPAPARYGFAIAAGVAGILVAVGIHGGLGAPGGLAENPAIYQPAPRLAVTQPLVTPAQPTPETHSAVSQPTPDVENVPPAETHPSVTLAGARHPASITRDLHRPVAVPSGPTVAKATPKPNAPARVTTVPQFAAGEMKIKAPISEAKPNTTDGGSVTTADMVVMMDPVVAKAPSSAPETGEKKEPETTLPAPAPRTARYTLTSMSSPETAGQAASFADLKRMLKNRDLDSAKAIEQSIKAREIRVPVLRRTF